MPYRDANFRDQSAIIKCYICLLKVEEFQNYLECDNCGNYFHLKCCGVTGINITTASSSNQWHCKPCKSLLIERAKKNINKTSPESNDNNKRQNTESSPSNINNDKLNQIINLIQNLQVSQDEVKKSVELVKENQEFISKQIDEHNLKLEKLLKEHQQLKSQFIRIEKEQTNNSAAFNVLKADMDGYKQNLLANNLIIGGLSHNVDVKVAIQNIMEKLNTSSTIDDVLETIVHVHLLE